MKKIEKGEAVSNDDISCYHYHKEDILFINCMYTITKCISEQHTKLLCLNCKNESLHVNLTCANVECLHCEVTDAVF